MQLEGEDTLMSGLLADQAALHGLLKRIRDLNLTLISVSCEIPASTSNQKGDSHDDD